jgi:hypothetical protein
MSWRQASTRVLWLEACLLATAVLLRAGAGAQQSGSQTANTSSHSQSGSGPGRSSSQGQTPTAIGPAQVGGSPSPKSIPNTSSIGPQQVPGAAKVSVAPADLNLGAAIDLALQNNLATLLASERRREAHGVQQQSRAGLLPHVSAESYQANLTENLAALGFTGARFPGFTSTFIGPFNNFDARSTAAGNLQSERY